MKAYSAGKDERECGRCGSRPQPAGTICWRPVAPVTVIAALKAAVNVPTRPQGRQLKLYQPKKAKT
ncbi:Uncharacterized protein APZ42_002960 [Daphnia magna]|uniref:Uncharacterized protein n=1 Tax=Daphnia magna TaxID=35525 RepID=A0A164HXJ3_9CRUS|nr:Uncharacterized protein APZ42_002960 [Daphnia magna]